MTYDQPYDTSGTHNYRILRTDYDNWAVVYACNPIFGGSWSWDDIYVLSRNPELTEAQFVEVETAIAESMHPNFNFWLWVTRSLTWTSQDCTYMTD